MPADYELSPMIKDAIYKNSDKAVNDLLVELLTEEIQWEHNKPDAPKEFKKQWQGMIARHCPYHEGD